MPGQDARTVEDEIAALAAAVRERTRGGATGASGAEPGDSGAEPGDSGAEPGGSGPEATTETANAARPATVVDHVCAVCPLCTAARLVSSGAAGQVLGAERLTELGAALRTALDILREAAGAVLAATEEAVPEDVATEEAVPEDPVPDEPGRTSGQSSPSTSTPRKGPA